MAKECEEFFEDGIVNRCMVPLRGCRRLCSSSATFRGRVVRNMVNDDRLGSMEFGCAGVWRKARSRLGHTACGALKGAIYDVMLRKLTGLLSPIGSAAEPCLARTSHPVALSFC